MFRMILAAGAAVAVGACGGDSPAEPGGPEYINASGTYDLVAVDGVPVPAKLPPRDTCGGDPPEVWLMEGGLLLQDQTPHPGQPETYSLGASILEHQCGGGMDQYGSNAVGEFLATQDSLMLQSAAVLVGESWFSVWPGSWGWDGSTVSIAMVVWGDTLVGTFRQ